MEAGLHGPGWNTEDGSRLGGRQIEIERQHDHRPLIDGQVTKASFELVGHGESSLVVGDIRIVVGQERELDGPPTSPTARVLAGANEQPGHPGIESIWIAQSRKASPRVDEGVLDGVFGQGVVAKDQPSDRIESAYR